MFILFKECMALKFFATKIIVIVTKSITEYKNAVSCSVEMNNVVRDYSVKF